MLVCKGLYNGKKKLNLPMCDVHTANCGWWHCTCTQINSFLYFWSKFFTTYPQSQDIDNCMEACLLRESQTKCENVILSAYTISIKVLFRSLDSPCELFRIQRDCIHCSFHGQYTLVVFGPGCPEIDFISSSTHNLGVVISHPKM